VEAASAHNGAMMLSLQMSGENVKNGNQSVVAINRQWQSTGGGNQPAVAINRRWQ